MLTEGWLDELVRWSLHDWPRIGMVGAVANFTAPPQQIPVSYDVRTLNGLDAFAAERRLKFAGQAQGVVRLTGFCLLVRREVLDKIGGFDERFGLGFFDDDDLSFRARDAGFQLVMALNVYVHHFGNRTFIGLNADRRRKLESNFELFRAKWGPERTVGYRALEPPPPGQTHDLPATPCPAEGLRLTVSLCMIVKNEKANLLRCLRSVADLVDEMIVVDTGSTDGTREVAEQCGAKVYDFAWVDDFSAARNESVYRARGDFIFWLDADEWLDEDNRRKLRSLLAAVKKSNVGFAMQQLSTEVDGTDARIAVEQVRLFLNHPEIRWEYRVHEQILLAIRRLGGDVCWTDIVIQHSGYQERALSQQKLNRNLRLLLLDQQDRPDDPVVLFHLSLAYQQLGRMAESLPLLRRSLEQSLPTSSHRPKLYALMVRAHHQLAQRQEAWDVCREGLSQYPDSVELLFLQAFLQREQGKYLEAEAGLNRLLWMQPEKSFVIVDPALRGFKARYELGLVYAAQHRTWEAEAQLQAVVEEQPRFTPAWQELGRIYLSGQRWPELEEAARAVEQFGPDLLEAVALRARGHLVRKEYAAARSLLENVIARAPLALKPRVILSHVLLQEDRDPVAAEKTLRDVLSLDPNHAEARHNLAVLRRQALP